MKFVGSICLASRSRGLFKLYKSQPTPEYPAKITELSSFEIVGCCKPVRTLVIAYASFKAKSFLLVSVNGCL